MPSPKVLAQMHGLRIYVCNVEMIVFYCLVKMRRLIEVCLSFMICFVSILVLGLVILSLEFIGC